MSILSEVLIEEYDRCQRRIHAYKYDLQKHPKGSVPYKRLKQGIGIAKKDRRMLWRAIGPSVHRKWKRWVIVDAEHKNKIMQSR